MVFHRSTSTLFRFVPVLGLLLLAGCGSGGPATHAVSGRIVLKGGDIAQLTGSTLEVALSTAPQVRGFGEIKPDGSFQLQSLQSGELRSGVLEGHYTARIIPNDDDRSTRLRAAKAIAPRYLKFETSGLKVNAPTPDSVVLNISTR